MHRTLTIFLAAAALAAAAGCAGPREAAPPLPFVEDDFPAALSRAREAKIPLFVEVWAPW